MPVYLERLASKRMQDSPWRGVVRPRPQACDSALHNQLLLPLRRDLI